MFVPWEALNLRQPTTALCVQGAERKRRRLSEKEVQAGEATAFKVYIQPLETLMSFRYLGLPLTATDYEWPVVIGNLLKARQSWACM